MHKKLFIHRSAKGHKRKAAKGFPDEEHHRSVNYFRLRSYGKRHPLLYS